MSNHPPVYRPKGAPHTSEGQRPVNEIVHPPVFRKNTAYFRLADMPMLSGLCAVPSERRVVFVLDTQGCTLRWYALPLQGMIPKMGILVWVVP